MFMSMLLQILVIVFMVFWAVLFMFPGGKA